MESEYHDGYNTSTSRPTNEKTITDNVGNGFRMMKS